MNGLKAAKPSDQLSNAVFEDPSQLSGSIGRMSIENTEINYVEGAHWTAILDGVCRFLEEVHHELMHGLDRRTQGLLRRSLGRLHAGIKPTRS